jgi:hypothetical protein
VGLVARVLEREGLPRVTLSSALDISERVKPPRTAFLDYPLGNQVGPPDDATLQRRILSAALGLFESVTDPGEVVRLRFEWPDAGWQDGVRATSREEAATVRRQRLAGEYENGVDIATQDCEEVCSLI